MNLYQLTARYQQLLDKDELTTEECAELESLHGDAEDHCVDRAKYIRNMESELTAVETAIEQMEDRADVLEIRIKKRKDELMDYMKLHNLIAVNKSPLFTIQMIKNPIAVDDFDKDMIPPEFWKTNEKMVVTKVPDKELIKVAIASGKEVPGARLITRSRLQFK